MPVEASAPGLAAALAPLAALAGLVDRINRPLFDHLTPAAPPGSFAADEAPPVTPAGVRGTSWFDQYFGRSAP